MSDADATPCSGEDVAIPEHLRGFLHVAAVRRVEKACDTAFVPDQLDAVRVAIHVLDDFECRRLPAETVAELAREAVDLRMPTQPPHSRGEFDELIEKLDPIRELVDLIDDLVEGDEPSPESAEG